MSDKGKQLLIELEGLRLREYADSAGYPTIGVGHRLLDSEISSGMVRIDGELIPYSAGISHDDAMRLLAQDLEVAERAVTRAERITAARLVQHQFDALVSFAFNLGAGVFRDSTLMECLRCGNLDAVPAQMRRWVFAGGFRVQGLVNRREKEIALWEGR